MLIKESENFEKGLSISIKKRVGEKDVSRQGAFKKGEKILFDITVPRPLGASGIVLRIKGDTEGATDIPFSFVDMTLSQDLYSLELDTDRYGVGLYFWEILIIRGADTLFTTTKNNVDFTLTRTSERPFHMLVYPSEFNTPSHFKGGIIYHVFVDRFCRGQGKSTLHTGVINEDWDNGIPQFAEKVGDPLSNDVFFGGNLWGIIEKIDYLKSLGVTDIYLSPIFESPSNHRYDTADYEKVDSLVGGDDAFDTLISAAHERGMRVILDGVFNHTGDDSRYFNRRGNYGKGGACDSKDSPYYPWFNFTEYPTDYEAWWGIEIMPRLKHENENCRRYFTGEGGVGEYWIKRGADGWRLDVADELSDEFLNEFRERVKSVKDAVIIGEVWENAVTKTAYSKRRKYFNGKQLDSVMNYPFKNAVIALVRDGDTKLFYDTVTEIYSSYPKCVLDSLMNIISSHDIPRALTVLGDESEGMGLSNRELSIKRLSKEERERAKNSLKLASVIQYTIFGVPSLYYGDEAGLEGYHDPFCRLPFPWGREDEELLAHYRFLGELRKKEVFKEGDFAFEEIHDDAIVYSRERKGEKITVAINLSDEEKSLGGLLVEPRNFKIF